MTDFTLLSDGQILSFICDNFSLLAAERDPAFPDNVIPLLERGRFTVVRRTEGFALAFKGRRYTAGDGFVEADLMFIHVAKEYEGRGIGKQLVEQVKHEVTAGLPILLMCEGEDRRRFFEACGFAVVDVEDKCYQMRWMPKDGILNYSTSS